MCDEADLAAWAGKALTRRGFGALGVAGAAAACAPINGDRNGEGTGTLAEGNVTFAGPDGTMDGFFVRPRTGRHPAVLFWPDIAGIREAKRQMARRLAGEGYAVLLANPYYRDVAGEQFADFAGFAGNGGFQKVTPWRGKFTGETVRRDAAAAVAWLDMQDSVDSARGIGTQGYCMTGSFALLGPAAAPTRIKAGASFHGGGLVREGEGSPHTQMRAGANYLIAIAQNDDAKAPSEKTTLREAADAADAQAEIEVYPADHGWCVLDSPSYDEAQAERAWARLLALYRAGL